MGAFPPPPCLSQQTVCVVSAVESSVVVVVVSGFVCFFDAIVGLVAAFFSLWLLLWFLWLPLLFLVAALWGGAEAAAGAVFPAPTAPWVEIAVGPPAGEEDFVVFDPSCPHHSISIRNLAGHYRCSRCGLLDWAVTPPFCRDIPLPCVPRFHKTSSRGDDNVHNNPFPAH